jgi:hypothetical protein
MRKQDRVAASQQQSRPQQQPENKPSGSIKIRVETILPIVNQSGGSGEISHPM